MKGIFVKNNNFIWRNIQGEAVLLNPADGKYYGLNAVGCSFWEKVDGERNEEDIINLLLEEFDVERGVLAQDINELVNDMESKEILLFK